MQDTHPSTGTPPLELIRQALEHLGHMVRLTEEAGATTHTVVVATGLEAPSVPESFGQYLVGVLAGAVGHDAQLSSDLLAQGVDAQAELQKKVISLIGNTNNFRTEKEILFRDTKRNAWMAEGIVHALMVLRAQHPSDCVVGAVHAVATLHPIPTQQGLDSVALYLDGTILVVAIGESKASRENGTDQLTEAAQIFRDIDNNQYGAQLRAELSTFKAILPPDLKAQVSDALWRNNRCYLPFIAHEAEFDLHARRLVLDRLSPPVDRKRLIALRLVDFHSFFDAVADSMRAAVPLVVI
ncbi:hypothetical protein ACFU3O_26640 [Streptomyces antibioticus]|uniref:hypothetical protein n=1 Tax=Streptomyces antibioticus TaxID=1890 RepID=UPI0036C41D02